MFRFSSSWIFNDKVKIMKIWDQDKWDSMTSTDKVKWSLAAIILGVIAISLFGDIFGIW